MPLVNCPECGGTVSSAAPTCPRCGHPHPGRPVAPVAPPPARGVSPGVLILGILVVGALVMGVLGVGVYRLMQRVNPPAERHPEELVDFVDTTGGANGEERPDLVGPNETPARHRGDGAGPPPGDSTFELSAVESPPDLLNREEAAAEISRNYPPLLRDAGVTGSVTLRMRIGSDGVVDPATIEVIESTHEAFAEAATRVASRMRFRPARAQGKRVPVWVTLPVTFQLAR
jgi:TonB family protein